MKLNRNYSPFLILLLILLFVVLTDVALAQFGGGGSYGGSSGGSGRSGDSGIARLLFWLVILAIENPPVGVPLLILAIIILIIFGKKAKKAKSTGTIRKASKLNRNQFEQKRLQFLQNLKQRDPGFNSQAFIERMKKAYLTLQEAWSKQDISSVQALISDGVCERIELQIEMLKAEGIRNSFEDVQIVSSRIVSIVSDKHFDTIHVEFTATGKIIDFDRRTGKKLRTITREPFTEYWSFMRKPSAKTLDKPGLVEGYCPNCGTPLKLSDVGRCESCDSVVTSGEYDWILTEITSALEWHAISDPNEIPGFVEFSGIDPSFSIQHIEDRTAVIFWRVMKTYFDNNSDTMRKMLLPPFFIEYSPRIRTDENGWWVYFKDAALGTVEVQNILPGGPDSMDKIEVLVKWSARNAMRNNEGKTRSTGDRTIRPQVYVLQRNHGVHTSSETSFLSAHCPGCGAPFEGGNTGFCDYCGRPLNDGSQDWVLAGIERFSVARISSATSSKVFKQLSRVPADVILSGMAAAMFADGVVDVKEEEMLQAFGRKRNISEEQIRQIINSVKSGQTLPSPQNLDETREILAAMARVALSDGKLSRPEEEMLFTFGAAQNLTRADVKLVISQQKMILYKQARIVIKENRRK